jgi:hypothetical protein
MRTLSVAAVLFAAACATTATTNATSPGLLLKGEHAGKRFDLKASAAVDAAGAARVDLDFTNHGDEPIGFDVDSVILQDAKGDTFLPLGKLQTFQNGGKKVENRVPYGTASIDPGEHQAIALEFDKLPAGASLKAVVPALYRLSIEGQVQMKPVEIPLVASGPAPAPAPAPKDRFFDPFVEW